MTKPDEPLPIPVDEGDFEEVSPEFIVDPGETLPGAVLADTDAAAPSPRRAPAPTAERVPVARIKTPSPQRAISPDASREHVHVRAKPSPAPAAPRAATEADATRPLESPRAPAPRTGFPVAVALLFLAVGGAGGFFAGRLWEQRAASGAPPAAATEAAAAAPRAPPQPAPKRATAPAKGRQAARTTRTAAPAPTAKGKLTVTAPAAAEILLDGKRIGKGSLTADVAPGAHRIEVRLGGSRVTERFEVGPNETWTYDVTPTN